MIYFLVLVLHTGYYGTASSSMVVMPAPYSQESCEAAVADLKKRAPAYVAFCVKGNR